MPVEFTTAAKLRELLVDYARRVRPTETDHGLAWRENFNDVDAASATFLLDSLRFVSLSTLHAGLKQRLD